MVYPCAVNQERVQRRTVGVLMATNSFGYAGFVAVIAIIGLLASEMLGSDRLAGIPSAAATIGTALAATPLALRSKRRGRRSGLMAGYLVGAIGAVLGFAAAQAGSFAVLVIAMGLFGVANASNLQNRFTAADLATEERRASSIALVVWVGTIGAVIGSPTSAWVNRRGIELGVAEWATPLLLGIIGFLVAATVVFLFLRPDPLVVAGGLDPEASGGNPLANAARSWKSIWPNSQARLAITAMAFSQMAMVAVMTMTPLHMRDHGHADLSTLVIALHVLGMFGLSPVIGRWADRWGRTRTLMIGAATLGVGTFVSVVAGYIPTLIFAGLFLLGVGWSFALIAGSALLTESLPLDERVGAQGLSDVAMSLLGAVAAFGSGLVKEGVGYHWLANFGTLTAIFILFMAMRALRASYEPAIQ
jgi:MFS family permease